MTSPEIIDKTYVQGGKDRKRMVRPGNMVELLPPRPEGKDPKDNRYLSQDQYILLSNWLGKGPYPIHEIGIWPCGRVMLYLKLSGGRLPGAYASDFKCV